VRELVLYSVTTADGFIADPNDNIGDWFVWDDEMKPFVNGFFQGTDTWIFGRVTYESVVPYWDAIADGHPMEGTPPLTPGDLEFASHLRGMTRFVVSRTLDDVPGDRKVIRDNVADEVARLKQEGTTDIVLSCGPELVAELSQRGLIDRFMFLACPNVIGRGKNLFQELDDELKLQLIDTTVFGSGIVVLRYRPADKP